VKSATARVVLFLLSYLVLLWLAAIPKGMAPPRYADLTWGVTASLAILAMTLAFLKHEARRPRDVGLGVSTGSPLRFTVGVVLGLIVYAATLLTISATVGPLTFTAVSPPPAGTVVLLVCSLIALSAMEELGFRGYALRTLTSAIGTWQAQVAVAIAFGLSHIAFGWTWQSVLFGVVPSALLFGAVAIASGGLAMPIGLHAAVNFAQWAVGEKETSGYGTLVMDPAHVARAQTVAPLVGACVPLLFTAAIWLWHARRRRND
jgi:membrane protease YdiL (CAAX protease family)